MSNAMKDNNRGEDIVGLLERFPAKSLGGVVQDLYDAARKEMSEQPERAIKHCKDVLDILENENQAQSMLYPEESAYTKGRFHVLFASIYLNGERNLEKAEEHYVHARDAFHSWQWCHLESIAYLGLAITQRKLANTQRKSGKLKEAIASCENAQNCIAHKSIPSRIDVTSIRKAIKKERERQESVSQELLTRIPIVSDIAAGLGRNPEENAEEHLYLYDDERKGADFGVRVVGDSMKGDDIFSGDIALIRRQPEVELEEIAAVIISTPTEPIGVIKKLYFYRERMDMRHWFLQSSNPLSEHLVVIPNDANVDEIKALYDRAIQSGRIRNPITYYEDAKLNVAGKYVGLVRES